MTSYAKKSEIEDVAGKIQGVKIYDDSTDGFIIQDTENDNIKATIGTGVVLHKTVEIGTNVHIGENILIERIDDTIRICDDVTIGTDIGTDLPTIPNNKVAIGNGVTIANGV